MDYTRCINHRIFMYVYNMYIYILHNVFNIQYVYNIHIYIYICMYVYYIRYFFIIIHTILNILLHTSIFLMCRFSAPLLFDSDFSPSGQFQPLRNISPLWFPGSCQSRKICTPTLWFRKINDFTSFVLKSGYSWLLSCPRIFLCFWFFVG